MIARESLWPASELVEVVQCLSFARSIAEIQAVVRTAARHLTGADGATFVLREGDSCFYADEDAISPLWKGQRFPMESCISGWVMGNRCPAVIADVSRDERIPYELYRPTFVRSLVMVPIRTLDPIGAIGNYWARRREPQPSEVRTLQALADVTAVAVENVRAWEQLEEARLETLQRLALAVEYRDDAAHEHAERVANASVLLARQLGLPREESEAIGQAAPLHDVGKLAVPESLLLKPGKLTPEEFAQVKRHAEAGAAILEGSTSRVLILAREIALTHHEWWDGTGYPTGLKGEDIPIAGRIVGLIDVFDALTHERPYKHAWSMRASLAEIHRLRGHQFDPAVVDAFSRLDPTRLLSPRRLASRQRRSSLAAA